ncbi:MAG: Cellulosome-anchoring protein precursor [Verrucomicrobiota bacterium]|jgi:hypothetical protein
MKRLLFLLLGLLLNQAVNSQSYPAATAVKINGGAAQRSRVTSISAVFSGDVAASIRPADLVLRNLTAGLDIPGEILQVAWDAARNEATWTFPTIATQALPQGNYIGRIRTPFKSPTGGLACTANSPLAPDLVFAFHAYHGDYDGDRDVDFLDNCFLRDTWDLSNPVQGFDPAFDFNRDGSVNTTDGPIFKENYFTILPPAPGLHAQLKNDTGYSPHDGVTSDPTVSGTLTSPNAAASLRARFMSGRPEYTSITAQLQPSGSFELLPATLNQINGSTLTLADHLLIIEALDNTGAVIASTELPFKLHAKNNCPPFFTSNPVNGAATKIGESSVAADLSRWSVVQYEFFRQPDADWVLSTDRTTVTQKVNADASIFLSDFDLVNSAITGTWKVNTADDDDFMGFVFGYQNDRQFYLFDWKQADQSDLGAVAERGMTVKAVKADGNITFGDLYNTAGGPAVKQLYHNTIPWEDFVEYRFFIDFKPGEFRIVVSRVDTGTELANFTIQDNTFQNGKFGFYNFSQGDLIYRGFTRQNVAQQTYVYDAEAIDPDGDPLRYSLKKGPPGLTVSQSTGLVAWAPGLSQAGPHDVVLLVEDGRGGQDEQSYVINVVNYDTPPSISLAATKYVVNPAEESIVSVVATDDVGVSSYGITVNGVSQPLSPDGTLRVSSADLGYISLVARAVDTAGQVRETAAQIRVRDPNELEPPPSGGTP